MSFIIINKNKGLLFHEFMLFSMLFPVPKLETYYNSETAGRLMMIGVLTQHDLLSQSFLFFLVSAPFLVLCARY